MGNSNVAVTEGSGKNVDTRTTNSDGDHRQVIVIGDPSVDAAVAEVASLDVGASSTAYGQVVRLAGSAQVNLVASSVGSLAVHLLSTGGTLGVRVGQIDGTTAVYLHSTGGTLGVNIGKIDDNVSVKFATVSGTAGVNLGKVDGTIQTNIGKIDDVVSIRFNTVAGTAGVNLGKVDGTIQVNIGKIDDRVSINGANSTTLTVKIDPAGAAFINAGYTASIFTVSGSTSGVSASGVTLVAPSANANFKVFAYSFQTTGISSMVLSLTNGAGTSPTEFWRPLVTAAATTSAPVGANLAIMPPGYLFATGVSTTLALLNLSGSLVHYSVSYIKESA